MRELKFRVWNKRYNEYIRPDYNIIGYIYPLDGTLGVSSSEQDDYIIEQYTGLKDKNGKEIYEGDIIRNTMPIATNKSSTYKVFYKVNSATFDVAPIDGKIDILSGCFNFAFISHYEVIGNIHENKELLEEE